MSTLPSTPEQSLLLQQEALPRQLETALQTHDAANETLSISNKQVLTLLDANKPIQNFFPEGTEIEKLPQHVQDSWSHVQKLSAEKQSKISYYEKAGEWFINLNGIKISLQNESVESNPEQWINVVNGNTYFAQSVALKHAASKGRELPTNTLWTKMLNFLGWHNQLRYILQIPLAGWIHPVNDDIKDYDNYTELWLADHRSCVAFYENGGHVHYGVDADSGHIVRLLDA